MQVDVSAEDEALADRVRELAVAVLSQLDLPSPELSVVLLDDAGIRPLNARWRDKDAPTDVLSFPQWDGGTTAPVTVLGDVVISVQTAARQAEERGHDLIDELRVLLVHGICHLLGHDHGEAEAAAAMRGEEERLLRGAWGASAVASLVARAGRGE